MERDEDQKLMRIEQISAKKGEFVHELELWGIMPLRVIVDSLIEDVSESRLKDTETKVFLLDDWLTKVEQTIDRLNIEAVHAIPGYAQGKYGGDHPTPGTPGPGSTKG
jgi:hypothetical protein